MEDIGNVPTCNLAEVVNASWLASKGFQGTMNLYEASVTDLSHALLQSAKAYAFSNCRYHGCGPSTKKLASRVRKGQANSPQNVGRMVSEAVLGTPMQKGKEKHTENVAKSIKRKKAGQVSLEENNATHRPDYVFEEVQHRQQRQRQDEDDSTIDNSNIIMERKIHKTMWAIRQIPKGSRVQCQGWLGSGSGKCQKNIPNRGGGGIAPSFWGIRVWGDVHGNTCGHQGSKMQFM